MNSFCWSAGLAGMAGWACWLVWLAGCGLAGCCLLAAAGWLGCLNGWLPSWPADWLAVLVCGSSASYVWRGCLWLLRLGWLFVVPMSGVGRSSIPGHDIVKRNCFKHVVREENSTNLTTAPKASPEMFGEKSIFRSLNVIFLFISFCVRG